MKQCFHYFETVNISFFGTVSNPHSAFRTPHYSNKRMTPNQSTLSQFHPLIRQWFVEQVGRPTDVQEQAWPKIAAGEHLLIRPPPEAARPWPPSSGPSTS